ncbi:MAG: PssD/Cps14F family polysaccharide biosynthesis glycosyltransferase [Eubacteriales bacterium]|nr:PssD/Cps14F family polysaccharide biosynthesis glycosyltransferase [Eubacteriales bacterium]
MNRKVKKVCFAASSGGHLEQLLMLKPLMDRYDSFILTEKTDYNSAICDVRTYYVRQVNRKEILFPLKLLANAFRETAVFIKERPDAVVSTGVLAVIPVCLLAKLFGKKLVYIESFAKVSSATETGKLMYRFADRFYVQWEPMKDIFPNAIYLGGIY